MLWHELQRLKSNDNTLLKLDLSKNVELISSEDLKNLFTILQTNTNLHALDLSNINLNNAEIVFEIAKMLMLNKSIKRLILNNCGLDYANSKQVIEGLKHNKTLVAFEFQNSMNDACLATLAEALKSYNNSLIRLSLDFGTSSVSQMGMAPFFEALLVYNKKVKELEIKQCYGFDNYLELIAKSKWLEKNTSLTSLKLDSNFISDFGVGNLVGALVSGNSNLKDLTLRNNYITINGAMLLSHAVCVYKKLRFLDVDNNNISQRGQDGLKAACRDRSKTQLIIGYQPIVPEQSNANNNNNIETNTKTVVKQTQKNVKEQTLPTSTRKESTAAFLNRRFATLQSSNSDSDSNLDNNNVVELDKIKRESLKSLEYDNFHATVLAVSDSKKSVVQSNNTQNIMDALDEEMIYNSDNNVSDDDFVSDNENASDNEDRSVRIGMRK